MRTALFTGAGASRAIGYPLTSEFLPRVRSELADGSLFAALADRDAEARDRDDLHRFLTGLLPGFESVQADRLPLITDVFSLVEHALVAGEALPIGGDASLRRCRELLKQAITDILLGEYLAPWDEEDPDQVRERKVLSRLTDWTLSQGAELGIVTTNYDIGLERELYAIIGVDVIGQDIDLGFDWRDAATGGERRRPASPRLRVYKLHGSLDLLRCRLCGYVYFNPYGSIAHQVFKEELDSYNTCHCRDDARLELHIVSPSLVREVREANLLSVWRSALEWLRRAEHWVIVGYSLPSEDLAVRSLLLRARSTAERPPRITVVQLGDAERHRYELLFPECKYVSDGLEGFLEAVP